MTWVDRWILDSTSSTNALNSNSNGDGDKKVPDFLTQQSLASFPIASAAITAIWKLAKDGLFKDDKWATTAWVPLVLSVLLVLAGIAATWGELGDNGERLGASLIGGFNALLLTAAVIGIELQVFS